jgi:hypothetical protein
MAQILLPNSKNAVTVEGPFGTFQNYWTALFASLARRLNASADVAPVSSPDASDLATAITLVNELKTRVNALNTALNS